jgi:glycosyltransferase involved in cell wall biosynthesis
LIGDRPLRILVVSNLYPSAAHPAFGIFVATRVTALRRIGMDVEVVAIRDPRTGRRVLVKYAGLTAAALWQALSAGLRRHRYDIVEAHIAFPTGLLALPVAIAHSARLVLFVHGSDVAMVARRSWLHRRLFQWIVRRASAIAVNSQYMRDATEELAGPCGDRIVVISPGVDIGLFGVQPVADAPRAGIVFAGRLASEKGIEVLLEALATVSARGRRLGLTVVGDGPLRATAEQRAAELGLDVDFEGSQPPQRVAQALRQARIVAVPSLREGLGIVALEAMAAGALVVASQVGGLRETVIDGRTGITVEPGSVVSLAEGIERALMIDTDTSAREAIISTARAMADQHAVDRSAELTVVLYRRLLAAAG